MKISFDIADPILPKVRKLVARVLTTPRALLEQGLRYVISRRKRKRPFHLRLVTSGGQGLRPELKDVSWEEIRGLSYEKDDE